jgi:uncharacterized damage-inducible protein DinB
MAKQTEKQSLADVFLTNNRINLFVLDAIKEEHLAVTHNARARNVGDQFAHLHNVRLMWLEVSKPALAKTLKKIEKGGATKKQLKEALNASAEAMAELLRDGEAGSAKLSKKGPNNFFAYVIAHEAHHRGQIILHLKYAGVPFDRTKGFEMWEWEKM